LPARRHLMTLHVIDEDLLVRALRRAAGPGDADKMETTVRRYLRRVDKEYADRPPVVSTSVAADMLGLRPPNVVLMRENKRLPEAFSFRPAGGPPVFALEDVERLRVELEENRAARAQARAEKAARPAPTRRRRKKAEEPVAA
jgi:hypothetical protein